MNREKPVLQETLGRDVAKTPVSFPISSPVHVIFIKMIKRRHRAQYRRQAEYKDRK